MVLCAVAIYISAPSTFHFSLFEIEVPLRETETLTDARNCKMALRYVYCYG